MELIREGDGKWKIAAIDFASLHEFEKNGRVTDEVQKKIDLLKKRSFKQHRDFPLLTRTAPERVSKSPLTSVEQTVTEPDSSWLDVLLTIGKYALYLVAIILILALVAVLWIGYGLVFAGHRLFKASCKDPSIQKIPAAERWAMAVGAPYAIAGNNHWARRAVNDDSVEAENDCKSEVESLADMWGVFDRDSLLEQLLALFVAGHRSVYDGISASLFHRRNVAFSLTSEINRVSVVAPGRIIRCCISHPVARSKSRPGRSLLIQLRVYKRRVRRNVQGQANSRY